MTNFRTRSVRSRRAAGEDGFTLIELLVVIMIIGILAAIALPAFLGQQLKGQDSAAKANARNMVTQISACYQEIEGYQGCGARLTTAETNLPIGTGPGEVQITVETPTAYEIVATSKGQSGGSHHTFTVSFDPATGVDHDCTQRGSGGCPTDGNW
jgi:type IV pilus assembly protein PilA